ncbi:unnamed protein product [Ceratitis capitata]|uniref:(Mediterranean fruit fly) hypothetical protein n=1 Tax=Ceratitis capitata TaxID=7213 RepID=A0A811ULA6_CERCA|nr:unnamed protein product [Ceratitis capitata]
MDLQVIILVGTQRTLWRPKQLTTAIKQHRNQDKTTKAVSVVQVTVTVTVTANPDDMPLSTIMLQQQP